jgi:8-oxo-dGTP pyrophosphatase MutT (NUDIX family)
MPPKSRSCGSPIPEGRGFAVVPAVYVYLLRGTPRSQREVLLQLRSGTGFRDGYWAAAVAGHVEPVESVWSAAVREASEEVGITVDPADLSPLCAMQRTGATGDPVDERVDYFLTCVRWTGEPTIREPHKCADLRWFDLTGLPDPVVPHELGVLEALRAGDVPPILTHGY